jgi:hypothetical protein
MTDDLEAWIIGNEEAAQRMLARTPDDPAFAQQALMHLSAIRELVSDQKRWKRAWSDNGKVKKGAKLDRDLTILGEYEKRIRNRNSGRSDTAIAADVGRLPRFNLSLSGVRKAIKRARAHLAKRSVHRTP